jgi:hypothetical protein
MVLYLTQDEPVNMPDAFWIRATASVNRGGERIQKIADFSDSIPAHRQPGLTMVQIIYHQF